LPIRIIETSMLQSRKIGCLREKTTFSASMLLTFFFFFFHGLGWGQTLLDNYDGVGDLTYTTAAATGQWTITGGIYDVGTGGVETPEHSYASYDLTGSLSGWTLNKVNNNKWFGAIRMLRATSGWGSTNYGAGAVLACNNSDFTSTSAQGYALVFEQNTTADKVTLIKFSQGIKDGATDLPINSTAIVSLTGVNPSASTNWINYYIEYQTDGKWKIYWIVQASVLSDAAAVNPANYTGGNVTSVSADETYTGSTYKFAGWVFAHSTNTASTSHAEYDNLGAGFSASSWVSAANGDWNNSATWTPASVPPAGAMVTVNHAVTVTAGNPVSNSGTVTVGVAGNLILADQFGNTVAGGLVVNGTFQINSGGWISGNAPNYGSGSTLKYNTNGDYGRGLEWSATTGAGYPHHVQLSNNTNFNFPNASNTARSMAGNLTIDAGSSFWMDWGGNNPTLTVARKCNHKWNP
jgi:hypothetical protein